MSIDLSQLQSEHLAWASHNFGKVFGDRTKAPLSMLGVMEELGELAHSMLKQHQNIRGTSEEHEVKMKDAIGDLIIFIVDVTSSLGYDLGTIVDATWDEVKVRDWKKFPKNGLTE